jgi:VCBS repeat-containing protein
LNTGITIKCPAGGPNCAGHYKATATIDHKVVRLSHGALTITAGKGHTLKFKLSKKAAKALKQAGHLKIRIRIVIADGTGKPITVNRTITLKKR